METIVYCLLDIGILGHENMENCSKVGCITKDVVCKAQDEPKGQGSAHYCVRCN